jgi:hypothetical protein
LIGGLHKPCVRRIIHPLKDHAWGSAMSALSRRKLLALTGSAAAAAMSGVINGVPFGRPYQSPFSAR